MEEHNTRRRAKKLRIHEADLPPRSPDAITEREATAKSSTPVIRHMIYIIHICSTGHYNNSSIHQSESFKRSCATKLWDEHLEGICVNY
jgi:hypothetical protein